VNTPGPEQDGVPDQDGASRLDTAALLAVVLATAYALRAVRVDRGWNEVTFAPRVSLSASMLSRVERGDRALHLDQMILIAAELGVRPSDALRFGENEAFPIGSAPWPGEPVDLTALVRAMPNPFDRL
jgi:transcriptional regulator with XRE-family HTH domain